MEQRPLEVGERDAAVDGEPLDLVEDRAVRRVGGVPPVRAAEGDDVDGRPLRLHDPDLRRRGLRPQYRLRVEVERGERRASRMPWREVQRREVVVGRLDLATVHDPVAEPEEDVLDLAADLRDQMQVAAPAALAGERDVDDARRAAAGRAPRAPAPRDGPRRPLQPPAQLVQRHAGLAVAHLAQRLRELGASAEEADAHALELVGRRGGRDRALCLAFRGPGSPSG